MTANYQQQIEDTTRRAAEPHPVENAYNALYQDFAKYTADPSRSTNDINSKMAQESAALVQNGTLPELSDEWAHNMIAHGIDLDKGNLEQYANDGKGTAFDATMASAFLKQYDQFGNFDILGFDHGVLGNKVDQAIEDADLAEAKLGSNSSLYNFDPSKLSSDQNFDPLNPRPYNPYNNQYLGNPHDPEEHNNNKQDGLFTPGPACDVTNPNQYKVKAGDTLWGIAAGVLKVPNDKENAKWILEETKRLEQLNPGVNPKHLRPDTNIKIDPYNFLTIQPD